MMQKCDEGCSIFSKIAMTNNNTFVTNNDILKDYTTLLFVKQDNLRHNRFYANDEVKKICLKRLCNHGCFVSNFSFPIKHSEALS